MKLYLNKFIAKPKGMAMIIVLIIAFIVLVTIGTGASIIANNLDKAGGQTLKAKAEANVAIALEKIKSRYKINKDLFNTCATDDCISSANIDPGQPVCFSCAAPESIYNLGDVKYQIKITNLVLPNIDVDPPTTGLVLLSATGYYKNVSQQKTTSLCLDYCNLAAYECGDNLCGGFCGVCPNDKPTCKDHKCQ